MIRIYPGLIRIYPGLDEEKCRFGLAHFRVGLAISGFHSEHPGGDWEYPGLIRNNQVGMKLVIAGMLACVVRICKFICVADCSSVMKIKSGR